VSRKTTILVVDDEPDIVRIVTRIMESCDYEVVTAQDGFEALSAAQESKPDVIILDLNLPGMNGFEVCHRLRTTEATRAIPIVMMTAAYVSIDDARRGHTSGADEYVVKPFLREVLIHNVQRLLSRG
jgi:CheY-like chemotaxis protein